MFEGREENNFNSETKRVPACREHKIAMVLRRGSFGKFYGCQQPGCKEVGYYIRDHCRLISYQDIEDLEELEYYKKIMEELKARGVLQEDERGTLKVKKGDSFTPL